LTVICRYIASTTMRYSDQTAADPCGCGKDLPLYVLPTVMQKHTICHGLLVLMHTALRDILCARQPETLCSKGVCTASSHDPLQCKLLSYASVLSDSCAKSSSSINHLR